MASSYIPCSPLYTSSLVSPGLSPVPAPLWCWCKESGSREDPSLLLPSFHTWSHISVFHSSLEDEDEWTIQVFWLSNLTFCFPFKYVIYSLLVFTSSIREVLSYCLMALSFQCGKHFCFDIPLWQTGYIEIVNAFVYLFRPFSPS